MSGRYFGLKSISANSSRDEFTSPASASSQTPVNHDVDLEAQTVNKGKNRAIKHTRPSSRVKFTAGPDSDSESEFEEVPLPSQNEESNSNDIGINFPQRPAPVHSPVHSPPLSPVSLPRSTDALPAYLSQDTVPFPPLAEEGSSVPLTENDAGSSLKRKGTALHSAYQRAQQLASRVRRPSYLTSRKRSDVEDDTPIPHISRFGDRTGTFPMETLNEKGSRNDENDDNHRPPPLRRASHTHEAGQIVRQFTMRDPVSKHRMAVPNSPPPQGHPPPFGEIDENLNLPTHYRVGVLGNLLRLYGTEQQKPTPSPSPIPSPQPPASPKPTPTRPPHSRGVSYDSAGRQVGRTKPKWYSKTQSTTSLPGLLSPGKPSPKHSHTSSASSQGESPGTPRLKRSRSSGMLTKAADKLKKKVRLEDEIRITVHIAAILSRQRYLTKLCEALMRYGAPTHRLEEYLAMTARVLEIDAQFLYLPGCMFVSFGDATTHTTDLRLLRYPQGVDLGKLKDVHEIYKEVVHDVIGVEEATARLDEIMARKQKFNKWHLILLYGFASATVGPFAFGARLIDMPIAFFLGCLVGSLNLLLVPRSVLYANIFELTAALLTSFLARAFGSIPRSQDTPDDKIFCFSALAQSSIALILPGYIVLCSSLELQSRNLLAGSVRLVFAIIYSLVLGFGMMLGTSFYGSMDDNASQAHTCPADPYLNEYASAFPFVLLFTVCLTLINQAKYKQVPMMLLTSFAGYTVNFFSAKHFSTNTQIANALGAFTIGVIGNLYSRIHHGLAAAAMLPAIFVQVPSGLAATGSLISGLQYANEMKNGEGRKTDTAKVYGDVVFELGYGMVQVSLAITVGLFLAALVVYPLGKRRSGLFSF